MVTHGFNRLVAACVLGAAVSIGSAAPAAAARTVSLSPASGAPGTSVTVTGAGFAALTSVDVFFDLTDLARAVSGGSGSISINVQIPKGAQPGTHWITLEVRHASLAAQAQFTVVGSWPQVGYGPSGRSFNSLEDTVDQTNADQLALAWSKPVTGSGYEPFVVFKGNVYVFDENGTLWAFSSTGALLWHAVAGPFRGTGQATPAANNGSIFAGNANGIVRAFSYLCRTDGGACTTTQWATNIGTAVNGGLTFRNGWLYAPGQDGLVHVINSYSGALATSLTPPFSTAAVTQPVAFGADGSMWIVQGTVVSETRPGGGASEQDQGSAASSLAVGSLDGYVTTGDGGLHQPFGWVKSIGATGCGVPPAFAKGVVYAISCTSIGAYDADTGVALWTAGVPGASTGIAVANGVLYACWGYRVRAYAAGSGGKLGGSGGYCEGAPEIVNGTVYSVGNGRVYAATLDGAISTVSTPRPDPSQLRPSAHIRRHSMR